MRVAHVDPEVAATPVAFSREPGAPQTIRVFLSSTFRDMHAERDQLSRVVFPELRSRCLKRGAEFLGLDLRWGVTEEEAEQEGALALCLKEIERCRPFFVCLLGDRFGWVSPPEEVPAPLFEAARDEGVLPPVIAECYSLDETVVPATYRLRRDWKLPKDVAEELPRYWESKGLPLAGDSITAREILRGVFEDGHPAMRAFCYLRKPGLDQHPAFPGSFIPVFAEQDLDRRRKLANLRQRILASAGQVSVREYEALYAGLRIDPALLPPGLSDGEQNALHDGVIAPDEWPRLSEPVRRAIGAHGTVALEGMDAFGQQLLDDLWLAIEAELERPAEILDAHQRERVYHERYVIDRTRLFLGRANETRRVAAYLANAEDHWPLVVTGPAGAGKSAFLARCVRLCIELHPSALVVPHFIGAAPNSAALPATLRSICETLRRELALDEEVETDPMKLRVQFGSLLAKADARRPVVVFLDALNQLDPAGRSHELDWIPYLLPAGTRLVVSTLAGDCLEQLRRRVPDDHVVEIPALPAEDRRVLVEQFLDVRRKKLTAGQLARILDTDRRPDAGLPLYLLVALEELCLFGDHEALSQRIDRLPERLPELFDQVLARLEQDHGRSTTESACSWIAVSRSGLLESELLDLLGGAGTFPRVRWTRLYRALEPYLKPAEEAMETEQRGAGLLDFYHQQLRFAAYRRYLAMTAPEGEATESYVAAHRWLAGYFRSIAWDETQPGGWRTERLRGLSELPYHQTRGERWNELAATLGSLEFVQAKAGSGMLRDLVADFGLADLQYRKISPGQSPWREWRHFVATQAHIIERYPHLIFQQAYNHSRKGSVARAAQRLVSEGRGPKGFWFELVNRPEHPAGQACLLTLEGHTGTVHSVSVSPGGETAVSASADRTIRVWRLDTGACLRVLEGHEGAVLWTHVTGGGTVLSASWDGTVRVWDPEAGKCLKTLAGHSGPVVFLAPVGASRVASASLDNSLRLWDYATGGCIKVFTGHSEPVNHFAVIGGDRIASASDDGSVRIWNMLDGQCLQTLSGHDGAVTYLSLVSDHLLASCSQDQSVRLWNVMSGECVARLADHKGPVVGALPLANDRLLSWSFDCTLRLWSIRSGECLKVIRDHDGPVLAAVLAGELLTSASQDGTVRLWDASSGEPRGVLRGHRFWVNGVAVSSDGRVISGSTDRSLRIWDAAAAGAPPEDLTSIVPEIVQSRALVKVIVRDGSTAISMTADPNQWQLWNLEDGICEQVVSAGSGMSKALSSEFYEALRRARTDGIQCGSTPSENEWGLMLNAVSEGRGGPVEGIGCQWARRLPDGLWEHQITILALYPLDCRPWAPVYDMERTIAFDRTTRAAHILRLHKPRGRP